MIRRNNLVASYPSDKSLGRPGYEANNLGRIAQNIIDNRS